MTNNIDIIDIRCTKCNCQINDLSITLPNNHDDLSVVCKRCHEMYQDNINPKHYKNGSIEVIDYIESLTANLSAEHAFNIGNVIKYVR